jgi:hypothetical protein
MLDRLSRPSENNLRTSFSVAGGSHKGHDCVPRDSNQRRCRSFDTIRSSANSPNANCTKPTQHVMPVARLNNRVLISVTFRIDTLYQSLLTTLCLSIKPDGKSQTRCNRPLTGNPIAVFRTPASVQRMPDRPTLHVTRTPRIGFGSAFSSSI